MITLSPGSPFTCRVSDASQILISGAATKMSPLNKPASLVIDSRGAEIAECKVSVLSTGGQELPVDMESIDSGKFKADFIPFEVGPHTVSVVMNGEPVGGSPFICNIYDVSKVLVTGLGSSKVNSKIFNLFPIFEFISKNEFVVARRLDSPSLSQWTLHRPVKERWSWS
jgi:filamin